jgi:NAD(P)-dependent dehydrogenase (short-subunit alcohol dehydrogenase family)
MSTFVYEQPSASSFKTLDTELLRAFRSLLGALTDGRPAVVVVRDEDLAAHGDPAAAAHAHALLGLVRSLAIEGERAGWSVNAVAVDDDTPAGAWVERLGDPQGLSGALVRLGIRHLGRTPV